MQNKYKRLGDYIRVIDNRNSELQVSLLLGVSIEKKFIDSHANTIGVDFKNYKIVKKGQFAYGPVTSRNGDKISIALLSEHENCLVSSSYITFEIVKENELLGEYLMLLFMNPEFDRYARYNSWGSAREIFSWEELCNTELYIPCIEEQQKIIQLCKKITERINILKEYNQTLEKMINIVYKNIFKDDISEILEKRALKEIITLIDNRGKTPPNTNKKTLYPLIEIASLKTDGRIVSNENCSKYVNKDIYDTWFRSGHPQKYDILFSTVGSIGQFKLFMGDIGCIAQNIVAFRCKNNQLGLYLYQNLLNKIEAILAYEIGSVQASIKVSQIVEMGIEIPSNELLEKFNRIAKPITENIYLNSLEIEKCNELYKNYIKSVF